MGDGLPVLLTVDYFYKKVVQFQADQERTEHDKNSRKQGKAGRQTELYEWEKQVED
jgi:hypothetical protein